MGSAVEELRNFTTITERPGDGATRDQLQILYTRYELARRFAAGKRVLEVACGAGVGLGLLGEVAAEVIGGDLDPDNCRFAQSTYIADRNITVRRLDAEDLPFPSGSFDLVVLFEAIYYLRDAGRFLAEARRVLKPGGILLISSVNRQWHGFNPSPFSTRYYSVTELETMLQESGYSTGSYAGFADAGGGTLRACVRRVRRAAVALRLIPKTMKGKRLLKRLFYGRLTTIPDRFAAGAAEPAELTPISSGLPLEAFRFFYLIAGRQE